MPLPEQTVLCDFCHNPMQIADTILAEPSGDVIAVRYVCGCQTPPTHKNFHAGQKMQEVPGSE